MDDKPTPEWQPIERLPLIAEMIDGYLADAQEQEQTLREAKQRPHVFDDALVDRIDKVSRRARDDGPVRAAAAPLAQLGPHRRSEAGRRPTRGPGAVPAPRTHPILALAAEIRQGTIDRVMDKAISSSASKSFLASAHRHDDREAAGSRW